MASAGLHELLELIYAPNAEGDAALNAMMLTDVLSAPLPIQPDKSNSNDSAEVATMPPDMSDEVIGTPDLDEARVVYEKLVDGTVSVEDICRLMS